MTLQQLRYFIQTAECGSISQAAEKLYISQPSLSKSISELEREMGISSAFHRRRARVCQPHAPALAKGISYAGGS